MHRPAGLALTALLLAAPIRAAELAWEGALSFDLIALGQSLEVAGYGVATVNAGWWLESIRFAGGIEGAATAPLTDPEVTGQGLLSVRLSPALGTGTLLRDVSAPPTAPQLEAGALALGGRARLCLLLPECGASLDVDLLTGAGSAGVGIGGLLTAGGFGDLRVSLEAQPWTLGTASLELHAPGSGTLVFASYGRAHGPLSFTGSTLFTTGGQGGSLQLVTPLQVVSEQGQALGGFSQLRVRFLPEPAGLVGLATGAAALLVLGYRRHREGR